MRWKRSGLACPQEGELREPLRNPMMLSLYRKTARPDQEGGNVPGDMEEMVGRYLESLYIRQLRADSGDQAEPAAPRGMCCGICSRSSPGR